jgi:hypothetical protein
MLIGVLLLIIANGIAMAQPSPITGLQNRSFFFPAADLTTNGVPSLTNTAPKLLVSAVQTNSAQGGRVTLVNTQVWVARYNGPANSQDQALAEVADDAGHVIVTGYSLGGGTDYDFATVKYGADGAVLWTNRYDGPSHGGDFARYIALDGAGNVYVTGDSAGSGGTDAATIKYSTNGAVVWVNRYNSSGTNIHYPVGLVADGAGNAFVLVNSLVGVSDYTLLKYDAAGNAAFTNHFRGPLGGPDYPQALAIDANGNVFATGGSDGVGTGEDYATVKFGNNGTGLWTNRYSRDFTDQPASVTVDRAGNLIVSGDSLGVGPHVYATIKYASGGSPLWTNLITGPTYQGGGVPLVAADGAGNVFVTGGSPGANGTDTDFTTVKLSSGGSPLWTNRFFEINIDNAAPGGTAVDNAGNFYFAGHSTGAGSGNVNFVTVKYTGAGAPVWTNRYSSAGNSGDYASDITVDAAGNVYVAGLTGGVFGAGDFATVKYADYVLYSPPANFVGTDSFSFTVVDPAGNTATGVVSIVVQPVLEFDTAATQPTPQGLSLQVNGARGTNAVVLYASTNFVSWVSILTNPPVQGSAQFLDSTATNRPRRFYRAVQ